MSKQKIGIALFAMLLVSMSCFRSAQAQSQGRGWSDPYRLSSEIGQASDGYPVADQYGNVHLFWVETLVDNRTRILKYARFDGVTWTNPNDIFTTGLAITNISPFVDQYGTLHIAWAEGLDGPAYYTRAPADDAISAQNWMKPIQIDIPARTVLFRVDLKGVFHILYVRQMEDPGVYYIRSEDQGATWSDPVWLDPDILPNHTPESLNFGVDENDGLHAVWVYGSLDPESNPDWVRYTHSLDGGNTWSKPILIDQVDEESQHYLTTSGPVMIVQGQTVHVVWAAGEQPYRYHRYSTDAGQTWSEPKQVFGELHGQSGDGLAIDGAGRLHFFAQIRYPMGIYHAIWDNNQWSAPALIYLVAREGELIGDRIHAHGTHPVVRVGNQLVLTFNDGGQTATNRHLFIMVRTLDDLSPIELVPTPVPTATPLPKPNPTSKPPTPLPTLIATEPISGIAAAQPVGKATRPDMVIWVALVPNLLLFGGFMVLQLVNRLKR